MDNKLEFYTSKKRMLKLIVICTIITLIGIYCINVDNLIINIVGFINLMMGLSGVLIGSYNIVINKPQLIISELGIEHKKITKKAILWYEISDAKIIKDKNQQILLIEHNGKIKLNRFKFIFKKTAKSDLKRNIIKINIDQLKIDYNRITQFLNYKLNKNVG